MLFACSIKIVIHCEQTKSKMSATHSAIHIARKDTDIVVDNGSESIMSGDKKTNRQASCKKFQFQERIPYVDEDCDGEVTCQNRDRGPRETLVTRIPAKIELSTLTHLARRPAVDIEFQDLSYSVRSPGRREGKLEHTLAINLVLVFSVLTTKITIKL
jgi:hypothetical protein